MRRLLLKAASSTILFSLVLFAGSACANAPAVTGVSGENRYQYILF
ncbi:MAG TPA: hypothetical protein GXZ67_07335 [Clostridiaceae bacterium]|nr:hypothetical protein [Clostridiaceae bacterium]